MSDGTSFYTDRCGQCKSVRVIMELADDGDIGVRCKDCGAFTCPEPAAKRGMTEAEIEAGRTAKGGFSRKQLQQWGVPWPPPKGWKLALMRGEDMARLGGKKAADDLLREVVLAIVEAGQSHLIDHLADVHDYFGARMPTSAEVSASRATLRNDEGPWT